MVAMYIATEPAHEIESGLVDLELARSVPRHRLLTRSLLLVVLAVAAGLSLMFAGTSHRRAALRRRRSHSCRPSRCGCCCWHISAAIAVCFGSVGLLARTRVAALDDGVHDGRAPHTS